MKLKKKNKKIDPSQLSWRKQIEINYEFKFLINPVLKNKIEKKTIKKGHKIT